MSKMLASSTYFTETLWVLFRTANVINEKSECPPICKLEAMFVLVCVLREITFYNKNKNHNQSFHSENSDIHTNL